MARQSPPPKPQSLGPITLTNHFDPNQLDQSQVLAHVLKADGIAGLYRGYVMAQLTWIPYFSIYFVAYERFRYTNLEERTPTNL